MILTTVYDLSKDYNMMLDKNVIDCFEETQISQETIANIIDMYNLEQNDIEGDYDNFCSHSNKNDTSTVNETSSTLHSINKKFDDNGMSLRYTNKITPDKIQYTGKNSKAFQITPKKHDINNSMKKLNNNEIHSNDKLVNGRIRKTNLSVESDGNSKNSTDRIVGPNKKNFGIFTHNGAQNIECSPNREWPKNEYVHPIDTRTGGKSKKSISK